MATRCQDPWIQTATSEKNAGSFPCGKCPNCLARRVSAWSFRLQQEFKRCLSGYFLTLTYDSQNVPYSTGKGKRISLKRGDIQSFLKRVRKSHETFYRKTGRSDLYKSYPIRYYAVGEYGGQFKRPHYHLLMFNIRPELMFSKSDMKALRYSDYNGKAEVECIQWGCYKKKKGKRNPVRTSWMGHVTVGKVSEASIGYCLKYISKPKKIPEYDGDTRQKEFSQCSLGIGLNYLTPQMIRWHRADLENRMYINIGDGKKAAMPRYYKKKIYTDEDKIKITLHVEREIQKEMELKIALGKVPTARDMQESYKYQVKRLAKNSQRERVIF